ncbi:MAG: hypothetical protein UDG86_07380 [Lachnospiraceae bacterium]|jgi:hypothetical protein|nr:hypothetical protein [Lachnospiraceae bacterium]
MNTHKIKLWKIILLVLISVLLISSGFIFFRFKDYYMSGTVIGKLNDYLRITINETTTFKALGDPGNEICLYYKDISKFKEGDTIRAICRPFIALSDPPVVDAYWIF